jgi:hypothetical protein
MYTTITYIILKTEWYAIHIINLLNAELNPICHFLALLAAHYILHVSRVRVKGLCVFHFPLLQYNGSKNLTGLLMYSKYFYRSLGNNFNLKMDKTMT